MKKLEKKIKNKNNLLNFPFLKKEKWDFEIENENRKQKYLRKRKQIKQNSPITKNDCWFECCWNDEWSESVWESKQVEIWLRDRSFVVRIQNHLWRKVKQEAAIEE